MIRTFLAAVAMFAAIPAFTQSTAATPKTKSELLYDFRDGQTKNSITPRNLRNFVASIPTVSGQYVATAYGAVGNGVADDTAAIQACIDAIPDSGGDCHLPRGTFVTTGTITVPSFASISGESTSMGSGESGEIGGTTLKGTGAYAVLSAAADTTNVTISNLTIEGIASSGSRGIYAPDSPIAWRIFNIYLKTFGDECIKLGDTGKEGFDGLFMGIFADGCLSVRTGRSGYIGALDIAVHDAKWVANQVTAAVYNPGADPWPGQSMYGSGYIAAIVVRGSSNFLTNNIGHVSQTGIVLLGQGPQQLIGNRADFNQGPGFVIASYEVSAIGNLALRNSMDSDGTYPGFLVTGGYETFIGNRIAQIPQDDGTTGHPRQGNGFADSADGDSNYYAGNQYMGNRYSGIASGMYTFSGGTKKVVFPDPADIGAETGAIPYYSTTGYSADADKFFADGTNTRLGIGTNAPTHSIHSYSTGESMLKMESNGSTAGIFFRDAARGANAKNWNCRTNVGNDSFICSAQSDDLGTENQFLIVTRSGATITKTTLPSVVAIGAGGSDNKGMCWKTASGGSRELGYCSSALDSSGNCTCN